MSLVMRILAGVTFIVVAACGGSGGGGDDCDSSDCELLATLNNKTLSFTYDFGVSTTDVFRLKTAFENPGPEFIAFIEGIAPNSFPVLCTVVSDVSKFDFWCLWLFANGDQNSYLFSVNANGSVQGAFAFTPLGQNPLTDVIQNPDAPFYASTASRPANEVVGRVFTEEMQRQRRNAEMAAMPIPVESTEALDAAYRAMHDHMSSIIESYPLN